MKRPLLPSKVPRIFIKLKNVIGHSPLAKGALIIAAITVVFSGVGAAYVLADGNKNEENDIVLAEIGTSQTEDQDSVDTDVTTSTSSEAPTSTAKANTTNTQKSTTGAQVDKKVEIIASIPRSSFKLGEDSGTVTVSMSDGSAVSWSVWAPDQSIYATRLNMSLMAPQQSLSFVVKANPLVASKTYTLQVEAMVHGASPKVRLATKTLTFTVTDPDPFELSPYVLTFRGQHCISHYVIPRYGSGANAGNITFTSSIVGGDPNGVNLVVTQSTSCLSLAPDGAAGERTVRLTASYNGFSASRNLAINLSAAE